MTFVHYTIFVVYRDDDSGTVAGHLNSSSLRTTPPRVRDCYCVPLPECPLADSQLALSRTAFRHDENYAASVNSKLKKAASKGVQDAQIEAREAIEGGWYGPSNDWAGGLLGAAGHVAVEKLFRVKRSSAVFQECLAAYERAAHAAWDAARELTKETA